MSVLATGSGADNSHGQFVGPYQVSPEIEYRRGIGNLFEQGGITITFQGNDLYSKFIGQGHFFVHIEAISTFDDPAGRFLTNPRNGG